MSVTLGVITRNRPRHLAQCLRSIATQTRLPDALILVNNGSRPIPRSVLDELPRNLPLTLISETTPSIPLSRNLCLRACGTDLLAFTDDDCIAPAQWLDKVWQSVGNFPEAAAVGGHVMNGGHGILGEANQILWESWLAAYRVERREGGRDIRFRRPRLIPSLLKREAEVRSLFTANVCYRVERLAMFGGFDESLLTMSDEELHWRMTQAGESLRYIPNNPVIHVHRGTFRAFIAQHFRYGIGFHQTRTLHPDMPGRLPGTLGRMVLASPVLALAGPMFLTASRRLGPRTPALLALMWAADAAFRAGVVHAARKNARRCRSRVPVSPTLPADLAE